MAWSLKVLRGLIKYLYTFFILLVISVPVTHIQATNIQCSDIAVIYARGSGQNTGASSVGDPLSDENFLRYEPQGKVFFQEIDKRVKNLSKEFIDLRNSDGKYNQYGYQAVDVTDGFAHRPTHRKDVPNKYYESVADGAEELAWYLEDKLTSCPFEQVVLGGYSQGAQVIGDALYKIKPNFRPRIAYVALYGDPKFNPRTSNIPIVTGPWARGNALASSSGALTGRNNYLPDEMFNRSGSWCDISDPVCSLFGLGQDMITKAIYEKFVDGTHSNIYQNKWIPQSANEIVNSLRTRNIIVTSNIQTQVYTNKNDKLYQTDLAIVLDVSGSMINSINNIKNKLDSFTNGLFNSYWDTRIALVGFSDNDTDSPYIVKVLNDFTYSKDTIKNNLSPISPKPKAGGDDPEAQIAGLMTAMEKLNWRQGAQKKILVISDAAPKQPDPIYGTWAKEQIVKKALELDPASISVMNPPRITEWKNLIDLYADYFSSATNGIRAKGTYSYYPEEILSAINSMDTLPVASVCTPSFINVGTAASFSGGDSYDSNGSIIKYEWDFNNDGVWDITSSNPLVEYTYSKPYSGLLVMQITSSDDGSAKATIDVNVISQAAEQAIPTTPDISTPSPRITDNAKIIWSNTYSNNTLIKITDEDGFVLALSNASELIELTDLPDESVAIKVSAGNENGWGEPASLVIPARLRSPDKPLVNTQRQGSNTIVSWQNNYSPDIKIIISYTNGQFLSEISESNSWNYVKSPGTPFSLVIYAQNQAGKSDAVVVSVSGIETNKDVAQTESNPKWLLDLQELYYAALRTPRIATGSFNNGTAADINTFQYFEESQPETSSAQVSRPVTNVQGAKETANTFTQPEAKKQDDRLGLTILFLLSVFVIIYYLYQNLFGQKTER